MNQSMRGELLLTPILLLSVMSLGTSESKCYFSSQSQTNTEALLRVNDSLNSLSSNKMTSVAALPGVIIQFNIQDLQGLAELDVRYCHSMLSYYTIFEKIYSSVITFDMSKEN